jgi:hypothetical protein
LDCFTFFTFGSDGKAFEEEDARDLLGFVFSGSEFSAAFRFAGFPSDFLDDLLLVFGVLSFFLRCVRLSVTLPLSVSWSLSLVFLDLVPFSFFSLLASFLEDRREI